MLPLDCIPLRGREGTPLIAVFKKMESDRISREPIFLKALFLKFCQKLPVPVLINVNGSKSSFLIF